MRFTPPGYERYDDATLIRMALEGGTWWPAHQQGKCWRDMCPYHHEEPE